MHLILALLTCAVFVGIGFLSEFIKKRTFSGAVLDVPGSADAAIGSTPFSPTIAVLPALGESAPRVEGYAVPEPLYYHRGHSWVAPQGGDTVLVGIDEFAAKMLGRPTRIVGPKVGDSFRQGESGWTLKRNDREVTMVFPLDGKVVAVNDEVVKNPELAVSDPYGRGWLCMVKTKTLTRNLRNLLNGAVARRWVEEAAAELRSLLGGSLGLVYQDGGLPEEGLIEHLRATEWRAVAARVFLVEPTE